MKKNSLILELLNINKLPKFITKSDSIDIKASEIKLDNDYKIYKYLSVSDIDILLTNSRRLDEPSKKIKEMNTLLYYFDEKNSEEYNNLINILETISEDDLKEIEMFQKEHKEICPITIKFPKDYLWQIYYLEKTNKYFMIVPVQETEQQAFVYLLKKKVEGSKEKIYVPVCNGKYENTLIDSAKIKKLENYLHYFTNYWPMTYEVHDTKDDISLYIIGKLKAFENIVSDYKIEAKNEEQIVKIYNLIDILFYLQTELSNYFDFMISLDAKGGIHFYYENMELTLDNLQDFYEDEIQRAIKSIQEIQKIQIGLSRKLNQNKILEKKLNAELMYKQKQISTFLECKKTFFGKVRYFFKYGKKNKKINIEEEQTNDMPVIESPKANNNLYDNDINDLVFICKDLKSKTLLAATARMDLQNSDMKINILKKKIENATLYIEEIESHKKNLFDFWKYTNKDEMEQLNEAQILSKNEEENFIEKSFNIEEDLEEFASKMDLSERTKLTDDEQNSVLITKTDIINDINSLLKKDKITTENFEKIQDGVLLDSININDKKTNHREKARNLDSILKINSKTDISEYKNELKKHMDNLNKAFNKNTLDRNLSVYGLKKPENKIMRFEIDPNKMVEDHKSLKIYKLNLKNKMHVLTYTNIIFFTNRNKTLPLGMDYSTEMLLDLKDINFVKIKEKTVYIINLSEDRTQKINIIEYNC